MVEDITVWINLLDREESEAFEVEIPVGKSVSWLQSHIVKLGYFNLTSISQIDGVLSQKIVLPNRTTLDPSYANRSLAVRLKDRSNSDDSVRNIGPALEVAKSFTESISFGDIPKIESPKERIDINIDLNIKQAKNTKRKSVSDPRTLRIESNPGELPSTPKNSLTVNTNRVVASPKSPNIVKPGEPLRVEWTDGKRFELNYMPQFTVWRVAERACLMNNRNFADYEVADSNGRPVAPKTIVADLPGRSILLTPKKNEIPTVRKPTRYVLCIDGSFVQNTTSIWFLVELEHQLQKQYDLKLHQVFDFFVGTGFGAVIATAIGGLRISALEVSRIFTSETMPSIFQKSKGKKYKYKGKSKHHHLCKFFGSSPLEKAYKFVMNMVYNPANQQTIAFTPHTRGLSMSDAVDAATCFPTLFSPKKIETNYYMAANFTCSNPTLAGYVEALSTFGDVAELKVLSVGSGNFHDNIKLDTSKLGSWNWFKSEYHELFSNDEIVQKQSEFLIGKQNYLRINSTEHLRCEPDNHSPEVLANYKKIGLSWFKLNEKEINQFFSGPTLEKLNSPPKTTASSNVRSPKQERHLRKSRSQNMIFLDQKTSFSTDDGRERVKEREREREITVFKTTDFEKPNSPLRIARNRWKVDS